MEKNKYGKYFYYFISFIFLIIGLLGINRLITKADLPFAYTAGDFKIISEEDYEAINTGDTILTLNGISIKSIYQLETILDEKSTGQDAELEIISAGNIKFNYHVQLVNYYRNLSFIIISLLAGLSFWLTSIFLINKKYNRKSVIALFWVLILFSLATMTSPGNYFPGTDWTAYVIRAAHVSTYFAGGLAFLYFTFVFPLNRTEGNKTILNFLFLYSILFSGVLITVQLLSISDISSGWVFLMEDLWRITELSLLIFIISGTVNLYLYYRKVRGLHEKKKIEWIFWGLSVGVFPFLFLWLLPDLMGYKDLIREEYLLAFLIFVPVFFTMAVVKYQVFEINVFIRKSLLYSVLTFTTIIIYLVVISFVSLFANDLMKESENLISILLILLIAYIYNPLQIRLRNFIDRIFYGEKYNFEKAVKDFSEGIKNQITIQGLSRYVVTEIKKIIQVKRIAFAVAVEKGNRLKILSQHNFDNLNEYLSTLRVKVIKSEADKIIGIKEKAEPGIEMNSSMSELLDRWGINIIFPFSVDSKNNSAAIFLGDKLSGLRFTKSDVEIINVLISNVKVAFEKLQLQEKLVLEELEISRLEEFNKMMSYYLSSVSHEIKTPLTSIKMFTEILKDQNNFMNGNSNEYLNIIEGESDRLSRLINNVLNYSKIKNGIKEYSFGRVNLNEIIEEVLKIMEYQFAIENFTVEKCLNENIIIIADTDAVKEALINILSNSIKYSAEKKFIRISTQTEGEYAVVRIEDNGIGISEEDIKNIFKPYVRLKNLNTKHTGGTGIGLSIVKNIIDAHKGRVEIESTLNRGSTFSLYFKLMNVRVYNDLVG